MSIYKYDASTNTYVLVDDSSLLGTDSSLANLSVATDLSDYAPGSTASVTATVGVGDTVTFNVSDVAGAAVSGTNQPWTVTDGGPGDLDGTANGVIQTSWAVGLDAAGQSFVLSATDQTAGAMVTTSFTDSPHTPVPAVVPANLTNGIVFLTGDTNTSTGTGIFPSFVQIQASPQEGGVEQAFNTDAAPVEDSGSSPQHNHSLLLSAVPIVTVNGVDYREFRLDLNEQSDPISLDKLQIYAATSGNLTSLAGLTQIYDMDGGADGKTGGGDDVDVSVGLTAWSSGSGHSDYKVLIPNSYFAGTDPGAYIYLYSQFSNADAGFEEWSVGPTSPAGTTPVAVVGIDKQISVDGTNWQDVGVYGTIAGSDAAPTLLAGSTVYYKVVVTNETVPNASDLNPEMLVSSLTDDPALSFQYQSGDTNNNGLIDLGESWTYTASTTAVDGLQPGGNGQKLQIDTATVTGTVTDQYGTTTSTNSDQANYIGVTPKIAIDKVTVDGTLDANGNLVLADGKGAAGDNLTIIAGENIIWEYKVTNPGDVALSNVTVTDDHTGVTPTSLLNGDGFNVGDTNEDGKLDTNETWIYTAAGVAIDGAYTNKGTASGSFTDSAGHTATPTASDSSGYIGVNPAIAIDKVTTGVDSVTVVNGVVTSMHTSTGDGLSFLAGYGVTWTYTVTNSGDVALANVAVTDDQPGVSPTAVLQGDHVHNVGDINDNGLLDVGESWIFTASGTSVLGNYSNTGTASGSFTDTAHHTVTPTASDSSSYIGTFTEQGGTLTQGFWGSHTDAWDGTLGKESNSTKSAYSSGVLSALDVNPRHDGNLLLGDSNHNGVADDAHDLLISDALAASILSSSTSGDARIIMLQQTIAAQLNIDNGKAEPNDLIDEAVMWLTGKGAWSGNGFTVDADNNGIIDTSGGKLAGSAVSTSGNAWQKYVDVTDPSSGIADWNGGKEAEGEGLKNALMWWNDGHLVISTSGQVAYDTNGTSAGGINPATVNLNTLDEFWLTLHQQTSLTGIA
ncbi:hypothetical protein MTX26_24065 [Bradyrhizobium sp. ISRA443]|uniref:hypothetical protein n=1 Tax=unclassified Bradyrhizobium TaxID=2631580 RepID=UPI002478F22A|nr:MULTISPECIES: hypothetical protein [unclassified Bradyrhizobium]WGR92980.1 hypothetical protein MTX20_34960 [Bradyrhizobium sp. ISRA435]WGR97473.1 hypothetical protein MTX23_24060 [Bradyrhizobium sp. ISRA436]WGS04362.1 hypothetical protein MTX18_24060 [Bradyrhizobium sp. ISRA437]WGS11245.1 hypothetical protein MTX26_24065 [Bradyrhizobium sp. ISRA443]